MYKFSDVHLYDTLPPLLCILVGVGNKRVIMGIFLGIGLIIGTVTTVAHFLVVMLPFAILASALTEKQEKERD